MTVAFYAHQLDIDIGTAVRDLELIAKASEPSELRLEQRVHTLYDGVGKGLSTTPPPRGGHLRLFLAATGATINHPHARPRSGGGLGVCPGEWYYFVSDVSAWVEPSTPQ